MYTTLISLEADEQYRDILPVELDVLLQRLSADGGHISLSQRGDLVGGGKRRDHHWTRCSSLGRTMHQCNAPESSSCLPILLAHGHVCSWHIKKLELSVTAVTSVTGLPTSTACGPLDRRDRLRMP